MKMKVNSLSVSITMASRIQNFLTLINDRLLQGKQMSQLTALWEEAHYYPKCKTLILKGDRQGQVCGKACIKEKETCMCHAPRPPKKEKPVETRDRCSTMGKKGQCKRFVVTGGLCEAHQPKEVVVCSLELKSGERKGTLCGKTCSKGKTVCPRHDAPKDKPVVPKDDIEPPKVDISSTKDKVKSKNEKVIESKETVVTIKKEKLTKGKK